jgi:hypothetical protein
MKSIKKLLEKLKLFFNPNIYIFHDPIKPIFINGDISSWKQEILQRLYKIEKQLREKNKIKDLYQIDLLIEHIRDFQVNEKILLVGIDGTVEG